MIENRRNLRMEPSCRLTTLLQICAVAPLPCKLTDSRIERRVSFCVSFEPPGWEKRGKETWKRYGKRSLSACDREQEKSAFLITFLFCLLNRAAPLPVNYQHHREAKPMWSEISNGRTATFEDPVDFRSYHLQLFHHKIKLPGTPGTCRCCLNILPFL